MSACYRTTLARLAGRDDITLHTLQEMPFIGRDDLRVSQENATPCGDYVACTESGIARLHRARTPCAGVWSGRMSSMCGA